MFWWKSKYGISILSSRDCSLGRLVMSFLKPRALSIWNRLEISCVERFGRRLDHPVQSMVTVIASTLLLPLRPSRASKWSLVPQQDVRIEILLSRSCRPRALMICVGIGWREPIYVKVSDILDFWTDWELITEILPDCGIKTQLCTTSSKDPGVYEVRHCVCDWVSWVRIAGVYNRCRMDWW